MTVERALRLIAGALRGPQCAAGHLREREFPVVHAVRGSEPVPVRVYQLVSDDGDPAKGRPARRHCSGDASHKYALTRQSSSAPNPFLSLWLIQGDTEDRSSGLAHLRRRSCPLVGAADLAPPARWVCPRERCRTHAGRRGRTTARNATTAGRHRDRTDRQGVGSCDSF